MAKKKKKSLSNVVNAIKDIASDAVNEAIGKDVKTIAKNTLSKKQYESAKYLTHEAKAGLQQGLGGIADKGLQETRSNLQKGQQKRNLSKKETVKNVIGALIPGVGTAMNAIDQTKEAVDIYKGKGSLLDKTIKSAQSNITNAVNQTPSKKAIDEATQLVGMYAKDDSDDKVKKFQEKIDKPIDEYSKRVQEEAQNQSGTVRTIGGAIQSIGNMAPSIALGAINPALGTFGLAAQASGQGTKEAEQQGKSLDEAIKIGNTKGAIEAGTEALTGGAKIFGGGNTLETAAKNAIDKTIKSKGINYVAKQALGVAGEIGEEELSNVLNYLQDKANGKKDAKLTWQEAGDTAKQTALTTILLNALTGGYAPSNFRQNTNQMNQVQDIVNRKNSGEIDAKTANQLMAQVQNGTFEQNQNLQRVAQESANQIANDPNTDLQEKTRQMEALNQTVAQEQQRINQNTLLDQQNMANNESLQQNNIINQETQNNANNTDYRGSHQIEQARPITDLSLDNIRNKLVEVDGYLTKQTESDLKTLEKIFNNPNEDVKIYRASPVNELNSGDWVTTDKSYAQEVANNNGGQVYEYTVKPSQLNYPDNVRELPSLHRASSFQVNMDNNSNIEYNQTNRGDINEKIRNDTRTNNERNNPVYDSETKKMGETISKREYSKREYERFENAIKTNESKSITKRQSEIRNKINNTTGKNVVFFDGDQTYKGGSSLNDRNSIYVSSNLSEAEQNFVVWHEVMESEILHNKNFKSKYANNAIDEILNDPNFDKVKENFIDGDESLKNVSDRLIAKDILCDIYAEQKSGEKVSYDNMLSKNTLDVINYTLERANEVMKGTSDSSFSNDKIQGLEDYSRSEIKNIATDYIKTALLYSDVDADIKGMEIIGSRNRGNARTDSDLDIVVELDGDNLREDDLFNVLNDDEEPLEIDGIRVDFNPIVSYRSGDLNEFMQRSNAYDKEVLSKSKNDNIAERKSDEVITAKQQTQRLNDVIKNPYEKVRQEQGNPVRSWVKTATTETGTTELVNSMDGKKITYEPTSNKKNMTRGKQLLQGLDYNDQVKTVQGWLRSNNRVTSEQVAATEMLLQDAIKRGDAQTTMELIEDASIMATEAGQTIQALSLIKNASPTGQLEMLQKIIQREQLKGNKSYDGVEIKENLVKDVLDSYNEDGTYNQQEFDKSMDALKQDIADQMKVTPFQKLNNWRYLSMLGNPKTHIRNIVANVAMQITSGTKNKIGAVGEALVSPFAKDMTRTKTLKKASQEISDFSREYTDTYFETNETRNKYTDTNQKGLKGDIESRVKAFGDKWFGARAMSKLSDWNTKALDVEDVVFNKSTVYRTFKNALTANGLTTKTDIENNPELVNTCFEYAVQQGKEATFHQDSKLSNVLSNAKSKLRDKNSSVLDKGIGLATEATIPFVKTPVNIAKTGIEYTPGLGMMTTIDNFRKAPNNMKASTLIDGLSKQFTGGILAAIGYELVKKGVLKGATGEDKKDELEKDLGFQGYSLKIGNNTYDLSWLSPSAMPLFVGAEMYGMSKKKNLRQADIENAFFSTIDPLTEMSFISSVQSALQSYSQGGKQLGDILKSMGKSYVTQYIPTLLSQLANATDDKQRSTRGDGFTDELKKQVMYKVPGLRQKLDANTDVWGNDKKNAENIYQRAFESFLSPANRKTTNIDATTKELERVYDATGSGLPNTKLQRNQLGEKLTSSEYAQFKKKYGKTAKENLDQLVNSDAYKNADDDEKEKMISAIYKYSTHKAKEQYADKNNIEYTPTTKYYALVDAFNIPMSEYTTANFSSIKPDYNSEGKAIKDSRKKKIVEAINNMNLTPTQKAVLLKKEYSSYKGSDKEIINYIQNSSLSLEEKYELAKYLKFKVK